MDHVVSPFEPSPQTTLAILLGASSWPLSSLQDSLAFKQSADKLRDYFCNPHLFGLPRENWLDLFDQHQNNPNAVDQDIGNFLDQRISQLRQTGTPARDLLFYYIGHGVLDPEQSYHLAIQSTRDENIGASAIAMASLAHTLKTKARYLRRIMILDCCFAAKSFKYMQSAPDRVAIEQTISAFKEKSEESGYPKRGTALLCSSGHKKASLILKDESGTMFSEALIRAISLDNTHQPIKPYLSLYDIKQSIIDNLEILVAEGAPTPEVHSPDQSDGDVASVPFFPNPHTKENMPTLTLQTTSTPSSLTTVTSSATSLPLQPDTKVAKSSLLQRFALLVLAGLLIAALIIGSILLTVHHIPPAGSITEFPIPTSGGKPSRITTGPDGTLWFTENGVDKIGHITPSGSITEYSVLTSNSFPVGITTGPDGNLWFTEPNSNHIGRITPNSSVTEYSIPTSDSYPGTIIAGPDGNLWFNEARGDKIGRITPSGSITEYPIPTPTSLSSEITLGPDGNLWFTEYTGNKIGRITPSGSITEYPIPTFNSFPSGITAGPDNNLWFTEEGNTKIGRITPNGSIVEYLISASDAVINSITAGPDDNLWFTEYNGNKVGRITPSGSITEYIIPTSKSFPAGITAGPDNNLWFTEYNGNKIGRITTGK